MVCFVGSFEASILAFSFKRHEEQKLAVVSQKTFDSQQALRGASYMFQNMMTENSIKVTFLYEMLIVNKANSPGLHRFSQSRSKVKANLLSTFELRQVPAKAYSILEHLVIGTNCLSKLRGACLGNPLFGVCGEPTRPVVECAKFSSVIKASELLFHQG